jgi:hypothetical protein
VIVIKGNKAFVARVPAGVKRELALFAEIQCQP